MKYDCYQIGWIILWGNTLLTNVFYFVPETYDFNHLSLLLLGRCLNTELCDQSFKEEVAWLKLRSLTLRSLAAAINLGKHGSPNNNMMGNGDTSRTSAVEVLQILLKEFQSHVQHCETLPLTTRVR